MRIAGKTLSEIASTVYRENLYNTFKSILERSPYAAGLVSGALALGGLTALTFGMPWSLLGLASIYIASTVAITAIDASEKEVNRFKLELNTKIGKKAKTTFSWMQKGLMSGAFASPTLLTVGSILGLFSGGLGSFGSLLTLSTSIASAVLIVASLIGVTVMREKLALWDQQNNHFDTSRTLYARDPSQAASLPLEPGGLSQAETSGERPLVKPAKITIVGLFTKLAEFTDRLLDSSRTHRQASRRAGACKPVSAKGLRRPSSTPTDSPAAKTGPASADRPKAGSVGDAAALDRSTSSATAASEDTAAEAAATGARGATKHP